jgi:hypothetical protein
MPSRASQRTSLCVAKAAAALAAVDDAFLRLSAVAVNSESTPLYRDIFPNMKKNLASYLTRFAPVFLLLAITLTTAGCLAVAAGAGAGAAVAYARGRLETTVPAGYEQTVTATSRAIEQLGFSKISERKDSLIDLITVRNAADKKIEIRLENLARELTRVRIQVGVFGDEPLSLAILDKIKANL